MITICFCNFSTECLCSGYSFTKCNFIAYLKIFYNMVECPYDWRNVTVYICIYTNKAIGCRLYGHTEFYFYAYASQMCCWSIFVCKYILLNQIWYFTQVFTSPNVKDVVILTLVLYWFTCMIYAEWNYVFLYLWILYGKLLLLDIRVSHCSVGMTHRYIELSVKPGLSPTINHKYPLQALCSFL